MNSISNDAIDNPIVTRYLNDVIDVWDKYEQEAQKAEGVCTLMRNFLVDIANDPLVEQLWNEKRHADVLFHDEQRGFVQKIHYHEPGHSNSPHDHGHYWVVYGVCRGLIEINTYDPHEDGTVSVHEKQTLTPGVAYPYLSGAIHSTRQLDPQGSIVLRFLSHDLAHVKRQRFDKSKIVETV